MTVKDMRSGHGWSRARASACGYLVFVLWMPALGLAQDRAAPAETRAETLRQAREERQLTPYRPNGLERAMSIVEDRLMPLLVRDGVHWKLGSLTTGSGF